MKRIVFFVLFLFISFYAFSEKIKVAVMPFDTDVREPQARALVEALKTSLSLDLELLKDVEPVDIEKGEDTDVNKIIKEKNPDRLLYTAFAASEVGYLISFTIINVEDGAVLNSIETPISRLSGPFEQLEKAVGTLIGALSSEKVELGRISIQNLGEKGKYSLFLNRIKIEDASGIIAPVLAGTYDWKVEQERFDKKVVIAEGKIVVSNKSDAVITFSVPVLLDKEKALIDKIREDAISAAISGDEQRLDELSAVWKGMFDDVSFSPSLVVYRGQEEGFKLLLEPGKLKRHIEETALEPDPFVVARIAELLDRVPRDTPYTALLTDTLYSCGEEYLLINVYHALRLFEQYKPGQALGRLKAVRPVLAYVSEQWQSWYENMLFFIEKSDSRYRQRQVGAKDFVLPVTEAIVAAGLDAAAIYFWLNDNSQQLRAQADALYPSYLAETDPVAAEQLHRQIEELYSQANRITFFKWGSTFAGAALSVFAPIHLFSAASRPQLELWGDISVIFPNEVAGMRSFFSVSASDRADWFSSHYREMAARIESR